MLINVRDFHKNILLPAGRYMVDINASKKMKAKLRTEKVAK